MFMLQGGVVSGSAQQRVSVKTERSGDWKEVGKFRAELRIL